MNIPLCGLCSYSSGWSVQKEEGVEKLRVVPKYTFTVDHQQTARCSSVCDLIHLVTTLTHVANHGPNCSWLAAHSRAAGTSTSACTRARTDMLLPYQHLGIVHEMLALQTVLPALTQNVWPATPHNYVMHFPYLASVFFAHQQPSPVLYSAKQCDWGGR